MARMALYGITKDMNEKACKEKFTTVFRKHAHVFYRDKETAVSRKILAVLVFDFYPIAKLMRRFVR